MISKSQPLLSIVSPVYRAENMVSKLVQEICEQVEKFTFDYEIILVEDGSPDNSWAEMEKIANSNSKVKIVKLSRNFGQHFAITAGLDFASGEWVIVMDCDLQDRPEEIQKLYTKAQEGFDIVLAQRVQRQHGIIDKLTSYFFYKVLSYLTGVKQDHTVANFGIYNQKVISTLRTMREATRYFPTMVKWVGFKTGYLKVAHGEREDGKSNYNFYKRLKLALDIMLAFSNKPLILTIKLGFIMSSSAFLFACIFLINALSGRYLVSGYASLIVSIWFLAGLIILLFGVLGLYISKIFDSVKNRPIYIVDKQQNI